MPPDHPILDQVVLGASSLFDVKRAPIAAHMTVFPQRPDAPIDAAGLLQVVDVIAPPEASRTKAACARCWPPRPPRT